MKPSLEELVESARKYQPTEEDIFNHRVSFAYGNAKIENDNVTREMVEKIAREKQAREQQKKK